MLRGALVVESIRVGAVLDDPNMVIRRLSRSAMSDLAPGQPLIWTLVEFEADVDPPSLANKLADALGSPGWYANFEVDDDVYVVFPSKVFRYRRGDGTGREEAMKYARAVGVPSNQLDW